MKNVKKREELTSELWSLMKDLDGYVKDLTWEDDVNQIKVDILSVIDDFVKNIKKV